MRHQTSSARAIAPIHAEADTSDAEVKVLREACRSRVLSALEDILKFDTDLSLRSIARRRYIELTDRSAA